MVFAVCTAFGLRSGWLLISAVTRLAIGFWDPGRMMSLTFPAVQVYQRGVGMSSCCCPCNGGLVKLHTGGRLFCRRTCDARCRVSSTTLQTSRGLKSSIGSPISYCCNLSVTQWENSSPISVSSLFEVVTEDLQMLNKNLQSGVGAENPLLTAAAEQIFNAGGKRLRPALVFLVSRATSQITGLKDLTTEHRRLAEIIEMIHTSSLIHDDVLDDSGMRRGKETIHKLFGTRVAVFTGDYMFAQSSWNLADLENTEVVKLIGQVIKDLASGEIRQASSLFNCDVTLDEYLLKSYYKTASLIAASTKAAAVFSGVNKSICDQMFEYGRNLGLSFQVVDDILDFTQSAEQLGKPAGSDLAKGNLTAPVIFALDKEPRLRDIVDSEFNESGSLDRAVQLVYECGGIERARDLAKEKADLAIKSLRCLPLNEYRNSLEKMVKYNLERID